MVTEKELIERAFVYVKERFQGRPPPKGETQWLLEWIAQLAPSDRRTALDSLQEKVCEAEPFTLCLVDLGKGGEYFLVSDRMVEKLRGKKGVTVLD